jgi:hypothetical protein
MSQQSFSIHRFSTGQGGALCIVSSLAPDSEPRDRKGDHRVCHLTWPSMNLPRKSTHIAEDQVNLCDAGVFVEESTVIAQLLEVCTVHVCHSLHHRTPNLKHQYRTGCCAVLCLLCMACCAVLCTVMVRCRGHGKTPQNLQMRPIATRRGVLLQ